MLQAVLEFASVQAVANETVDEGVPFLRSLRGADVIREVVSFNTFKNYVEIHIDYVLFSLVKTEKLFKGIQTNDFEQVQKAVYGGADLSMRDEQGRFAFHQALMSQEVINSFKYIPCPCIFNFRLVL